jgi:hypothetical protein
VLLTCGGVSLLPPQAVSKGTITLAAANQRMGLLMDLILCFLLWNELALVKKQTAGWNFTGQTSTRRHARVAPVDPDYGNMPPLTSITAAWM